MKRLAPLLTLLLAVLLGAPATPVAAADGDGSRQPAGSARGKDDGRRSFGLQPATAEGPDQRAFFSFSVTPGAVVEDHLAVINVSSRPARLTVYPADAFNEPSGGFDVTAAAVAPREVGRWLQLPGRSTPLVLKVPARSHLVLPIRLTVPGDATPGDHAGGIVASLRTYATGKDGSSQVAIDQRTGVRVYTRVSGTLRPHLSVTGLRAAFHGSRTGQHGYLVATWTVRNDGNVILGGHQYLRATAPFTRVDGPKLPVLDQLLPGESHRMRARLSAVPRAGRLAVTAVVVPSSLPGVVDPRLPVGSATTHVWALPWVVLALLLLLLGAGAVWWRRRRRGAAADGPPPETGGAQVIRLPEAGREVPDLERPALRATLGSLVGLAVMVLGVCVASPAAQAADDDLTFVPGSGMDITTTYIVSTDPCPAAATNVVAVATGHGFPADGQVVVPNTSAPVRHDAPMVIHLQDTFSGFAAINATRLDGRYRVTLRCIDSLAQTVYASFTGSIVFADPTHFTAPTPSVATQETIVAAGPAERTVPGGPSDSGPAIGSNGTAAGGDGTTEGSGDVTDPGEGRQPTGGGSDPAGTASDAATSPASPTGGASATARDSATPTSKESHSSLVLPGLVALAGLAGLLGGGYALRRRAATR